MQLVDQEKFGDNEDEDYMVLNVKGGNNETKPYYMKGFINGNRFKTMIDTGSPVTIFALDEIKRIMKREKLPVRQMIEGERYVDFIGKPLQLLGYVFCELQLYPKNQNSNCPKWSQINNRQRVADNFKMQAGTRKG